MPRTANKMSIEEAKHMRILCGFLFGCLLLLLTVSCQQRRVQGNQPQVFEAVRRGDVATLQRILRNQPEVVKAVEPEYGATLLHIAAQQGQIPVMRVLIERQADLNAKDMVGRTPLHYALMVGKRPAVQLLLEKGADIHIQAEEGMTCLHSATMSNDPVLVQLCVERGISVDAKSLLGTPLHLAAMSNASKSAAELIRCGASVHAVTQESKETPLHWAAASDSLEVAQLLLRHGARVDARSAQGWTPLHVACNYAKGTRVAELLLQHGADPNATDDAGRTPLFNLAIKSGQVDNTVPEELRDRLQQHQQGLRSQALALAQLLLSRGANPHLRDRSGVTSVDLASHSGFSEMVSLLQGK